MISIDQEGASCPHRSELRRPSCIEWCCRKYATEKDDRRRARSKPPRADQTRPPRVLQTRHMGDGPDLWENTRTEVALHRKDKEDEEACPPSVRGSRIRKNLFVIREWSSPTESNHNHTRDYRFQTIQMEDVLQEYLEFVLLERWGSSFLLLQDSCLVREELVFQ